MEEYRALLDRVLSRFRALSRDMAANLSDDVPEQASFKLAFKDYFDAFGRFYNSTYNDWLAFRSSTEEAHTFDVGLEDWRDRYIAISGLDPSNPNASESDTWRRLRILGWGALGVGALFGVGWLVASSVKGAAVFKPSLTIGGDDERIRGEAPAPLPGETREAYLIRARAILAADEAADQAEFDSQWEAEKAARPRSIGGIRRRIRR